MSNPITLDIPEFKDGASGGTPITASALNKIVTAVRQAATAINESGGLVPADLRTIFYDDFAVGNAILSDATPPIGVGYTETLGGRYEINGTAKVLQVKSGGATAPDLNGPAYARVEATTGTDQALSYIARLRTNPVAPVTTRLGMGRKVGSTDGVYTEIVGFTGGHTIRVIVVTGGNESTVATIDPSALAANVADQNVLGSMNLNGSTLTATLNTGTVQATLSSLQLRALEGYNSSSFVSTDDRLRLDNWTHLGRVPITTGISVDQLGDFIAQPGPARDAVMQLINDSLNLSRPGTVGLRADGRPVFYPEGA